MNTEPNQPEQAQPSPLGEREPYVPPTVEDIDTTYGPAETSAGVPGSY
jgi:hypothetical protein